MDPESRKYILSKMKDLVYLTNYKKLLRACEEERLLSNVMCARIENLSDATEEQKHMELFNKITKRGPQAFDTLIYILNNYGFPAAADLLHKRKTKDSTYISMHNKENKNKSPPPPSLPVAQNRSKSISQYVPEGCYPTKEIVHDQKLPLKPFTEKETPIIPLEVIKSTAIQQNPKMPVYSMRTKHRGVMLMVNIIDFPKSNMAKREGAEIDGLHLRFLFREMGFTCFSYVNLTSEQFFDIVKRLCNSEYVERTESFVLILMSHGEMTKDMHDRVEFHDGSIVKLQDIEDKFTNVSCNNLRNKPKILFFPFCRGQTTDKGIRSLEKDQSTCRSLQKDGYSYLPTTLSTDMPSKSDMIVCYATVCGFQTMRDTAEGTWYVQTLCKVFAKHAHDTHLEDMLKIIGDEIKKLRSLKGEMQTPAFNNHGFTKCLFFNPGVYEE